MMKILKDILQDSAGHLSSKRCLAFASFGVASTLAFMYPGSTSSPISEFLTFSGACAGLSLAEWFSDKP